ncbi:protoporphyrinogen oxidase HemJ [Rickettsiales bacterium]|nr:protoporphyrinogen oxidase HemJ [Rickettsiales bacterium]
MDIEFYYKFAKTLHIIFFTTWMSGIFYLPRIFVYHSECKIKSEQDSTFKIMEKKLYAYIMNPSLLGTWVFGIILVIITEEVEKWLLLKFFLVVGITFFHFYCSKIIKMFQKGENKRNHKFYRIINEIPTVLFIFVVILVIFKPFI